MFIYLRDGRIVEVARVTRVQVEKKQLVLYQEGGVTASFPLQEVYFSSDRICSPIPA
jgi:hypothetical protein